MGGRADGALGCRRSQMGRWSASQIKWGAEEVIDHGFATAADPESFDQLGSDTLASRGKFGAVWSAEAAS